MQQHGRTAVCDGKVNRGTTADHRRDHGRGLQDGDAPVNDQHFQCHTTQRLLDGMAHYYLYKEALLVYVLKNRKRMRKNKKENHLFEVPEKEALMQAGK